MSKEKEIKIEDGNVEEPVINEGNVSDNEEIETSEGAETKDTTTEPVEEKDPLEAALEENVKLKDQLLRTIAEFENYKKRTLKEKTELILNGGEKTITAVLPVLDDFERAIADTTDDPAAIKEGMELIFHKFVKTLEGLGVKKIATDDADFNVDYHEAIAMVPGVGDDKKGKVIDCVQTGYMLNDKVIRHAKVAVGQ
ncbi:MAG: nucleotide exchange factor GrpE [Prevotella sp.]|nr:nucleotide exchange factor GrpE [Prevotella sp.]